TRRSSDLGRAGAVAAGHRAALVAVAGGPCAGADAAACRPGGTRGGYTAATAAGGRARGGAPAVGRWPATCGTGPAVSRQRRRHGRSRPCRAATRLDGGPVPACGCGPGSGGRPRRVRTYGAHLAVRRLCRTPAGGPRAGRAAGRGHPYLGVAAMNARTRGRLVGAALIGLPVVLAVMALWFFGGYERVERRERLPPSGEAASDPLYALRKALEADGITVEARDTLEPPRFLGRHRDTVLLHGDPSVVADAEAHALLAWVERGGHLVLRTPRRGDPAEMPLLAALGVQALKPQACEPLHLQGEPPHQEFCGGRRFVLADGQALQLQWGDPETGLGHARWQRGKGAVDLIAQLDFVTTRGRRDVPPRARARQALPPNRDSGTVHLVRGGSPLPPFLRLLAWSWPLWLPLALRLMAGLWRHGQRLGPWQP